AILKDPATYEHVRPETVGNRRRVLVSDQAGKSNVLAELDRSGLISELEGLGITIARDDARVARLLEEVKAREAKGYSYENAPASFELLARRFLDNVPSYFDVKKFDVNVEQRISAKGERVTVTLAVVKVAVD